MMGSSCESCEAQQRSCHRRTRCSSGMDRVVHHSEMSVHGTGLWEVFMGQFVCQDLFEEMSSTHCGGAWFTPNHHTPMNFAFKVNY